MINIQKQTSKARPWIYAHRETILIILSVFLFYLYGPFSREFDKTAAPLEIGALSAIIIAGIALLVSKKITWYLLRSIWPDLHKYIRDEFPTDFRKLTPWQKIKISLLAYASLVLALIIAFKASL